MIRFNDVDLVTPKGECLASNLDFTITPSTPLMVTGANAVGKSSLFRAMGSVWEVKKGHIDKPCDDTGRLDIIDIFCAAACLYGSRSLGDQITYPLIIRKEKRTKADEDKMLNCLKLVGIDFLVKRENGFDTVKKWEDTLSLGSNNVLQCHAYSSINHHSEYLMNVQKPSCTEENLYKNANTITCITISNAWR